MLTLFGIACFGQAAPGDCLSYEPTVVNLRGTLIRSTLPGPANYQDVRRGDTAETSWFLELDSSICVNVDNSQPDLNPSQADIRKVQLVLQASMYKRYRALLGRKVVARGTLFGAHTGHHHTPVLLTVKSLQLAQGK